MNRLDNLIRELCPYGVAYTRIADISTVLRGKRLTKNELTIAGAFPVFHGGLEPLGFYSQKNREADTTMVINVGASAGTVGFCERDFWSSDGCFCISHSEHALSKYVYYVLVNQQSFLMSKVRKAGIPTLDAKVVENLQIPLPPLAVQQEIVRILDSFTELTAELNEKLAAELTARRKQYEHYRDELLTFGDNVPKATLGEICDFKYGKGNNIPNETGEYPVYGCNGIVSTTNVFNSEDAPIIGHIGSAGIVNWGAGKHYVTYNGTICKANPEKVLSKYAYHLLCSLHLERFVKGSQPFLSYGDFSKEIVSVPTLAEQQRVITLLDHFDTICNDLVSGLPAEITARQKQYEYYRDKLLTFKELER